MNNEIIEWNVLEFELHEKSGDWYWILGIVVVIGALISIVLGNTLFALLVIIGGFIIGVYASKQPDMLNCAVDRRGVHVDNISYLYRDIDSFWIDEPMEGNPKILMTLKNKLAMHISIPVGDVDLEDLHEFLTAYIHEEEQNEGLTEQVMQWLKI